MHTHMYYNYTDKKLTVRAVKILLVDSISLRSKFLSRHDMSMTIWRTWCSSIYKNSETFEHKSQITHKTGDTKPHHLFYSILFHVKLMYLSRKINKTGRKQIISTLGNKFRPKHDLNAMCINIKQKTCLTKLKPFVFFYHTAFARNSWIR